MKNIEHRNWNLLTRRREKKRKMRLNFRQVLFTIVSTGIQRRFEEEEEEEDYTAPQTCTLKRYS